MTSSNKKNRKSTENSTILSFQTSHIIREGDARDMSFLPSESIHCVITSPPYADLIHYPEGPGQLGNMASYELFLDELDKVWAECLRVLVPGGRVVCVVGDVCISRRAGGRHQGGGLGAPRRRGRGEIRPTGHPGQQRRLDAPAQGLR